MTKFWYNLKHNNWILTLFVVSIVVAVVDIALVIFDVIQLSNIAVNSASLSGVFLFFNIFAIVLNVLFVALMVIYAFVRKS